MNHWFPRRREITEIVGRLSSGRTRLSFAWLAQVTCGSGTAAIVDADDTFDPVSAARAGVDLRRLLWVRCGGRRDVAFAATDALVRCHGFTLIVLDTGETAPRLTLADAFRWRLAVQRVDTALVIVGRRRVAGGGAAVAIETVRDGVEWSGPGTRTTRLAAMRTSLHLLRPQTVAHPQAGSLQWPRRIRWMA